MEKFLPIPGPASGVLASAAEPRRWWAAGKDAPNEPSIPIRRDQSYCTFLAILLESLKQPSAGDEYRFMLRGTVG